ncbi:MgtC/SapB family protein [Leifsonia aquatica]|uniref:MgtC/SapB family protein n=1 Tax=Leifsonia aquatica TaxID=144185 RepID=UPI00384FB5B8
MSHIHWIGANTLDELLLLSLAFVLSAAVGLERHRRLKSAGLRTHTLVGVGAAVFTLVGSYGFAIEGDAAAHDPSRIAAQIVSGIGFLGAGVIFVRRNSVSGLTTAASIWATAAIGMACGAGAPLLALMATALQLIAVVALRAVGRWIRTDPPSRTFVLRYRPGEGSLRSALSAAAEQGVTAVVVETDIVERPGRSSRIEATIELQGSAGQFDQVIHDMSDISGVKSVRIVDDDDP